MLARASESLALLPDYFCRWPGEGQTINYSTDFQKKDNKIIDKLLIYIGFYTF